jgi:BolA protein
MTHPLILKLYDHLHKHMQAESLKIEDQSHKHAGHGGAQEGVISHLKITLSSPLLRTLSPVAGQRLLYKHVHMVMPHVHSISFKIIP